MTGRDVSAASPDMTDAATIARFLGVSVRMISKLSVSGLVVQVGANLFELEESVRN
jgi:hypothetical protein